jgi:hypothetical protein
LHGDQGTFTVSRGLELYWGSPQQNSLEAYNANLLGVRNVIPYLLPLFANSGARATVGFLLFDEKGELSAHVPLLKPG